jgi:hypothetical protein
MAVPEKEEGFVHMDQLLEIEDLLEELDGKR